MTTATSITVRVPLAIRHRPGRKTVVTPTTDGVASVTTRADPTLVKALARGFRYQRMLDQGLYASLTEMAAAERVDRGYLGRLIKLALLAPDIVEAILEAQWAESPGLPTLMRSFPVEWIEQRRTSALLASSPVRATAAAAP